MLLLLVNSTGSLYVCAYVCHGLLRFDEIFLATSFFVPILFSMWISLSLPLSLPFLLIGNVVARSSLLFVLLSLMCKRTMIIVIREIFKFDDRLSDGDSV